MAENCPLVTRADDKKSSYSHTNEGIENWSFGANFNGREGCNSQINRALENFEVDPSPGKLICTATDASRNQKVKAKLLSIETIEIHSFLQRKNGNKVLCSHCETNNSEDMVPQDKNRFGNIIRMKCNKCGKTTEVDSWWMFDKYKDVKEDIFRFLCYQNPTKTLCRKEGCNTNDEADIVP